MAKPKKTSAPLPEYTKWSEQEMVHRAILFRSHEAFTVGNEAGLYDALCCCKALSIPLPKWALDAIIIRERELLLGKKNNRHAKWQQRFKGDMQDRARFETYEQCLEHGVQEKVVFEVVSRALAGTVDAGQPSTMREACKRFKRRQKENPLRYYIPHWCIPVQELRPYTLPSRAPGGGMRFNLESRTLGKLRPRRKPVDSEFDSRLLCPPWDPKLLL